MQDYESARRLLGELQRPYGAEVMFVYLDMLLLTGDDDTLLREINVMLDQAGEDTPVARSEALTFALFFLGTARYCDRLFDAAEEADLGAIRVREPAPDSMLAACYLEGGN